jgi:hypothetical protein
MCKQLADAKLDRMRQENQTRESERFQAISEELSSIVVDEGFCQAAASWDLTPSVN